MYGLVIHKLLLQVKNSNPLCNYTNNIKYTTNKFVLIMFLEKNIPVPFR